MKMLSCFFSLAFLVLFSCGEDNPKKQNPGIDTSITVTSPSENKLLIGSITVEAEVEQSGFEKAEVYLNSTLIGETTNPSVSLTYDTRLIADGEYELRVVAINDEDEEEEASINVEVFNKLLTVIIPPNLLDGNFQDEVWAFITNPEGELLGTLKGNNNTTLTFQTPDDYVKGGDIVLHQVIHDDRDPGSTTRIFTYPGIVAGGTYMFRASASRQVVGTHQVTVTSVPVNYNKVIMSGPQVLGFNGMGTTTKTMNTNLTATPTDIACYLTGSDRSVTGVYKTFSNVAAGGTTSTAFTNFIAMQSVDITLPSQAEFFQGFTAHFPPGTRSYFSTIDNFSAFDATTGVLYYPGTLYSEYLIGIAQETGNRRHVYQKIGAIPNTVTANKLDADITALTYTDNLLSFTSSGSYDVGLFESLQTYSSDGVDHDLFWFVSTDNSTDQEIILPEIPAAIISAIPQLADGVVNFENGVIILSEYDAIDGYAEYLTKELQSSDPLIANYNESMVLAIYLDEAGARKRKVSPDF